MNTIRRRFSLLLILCIFTGIAAFAAAPVTLRGRVADAATKEPLAAVNIRVLGSARGTVTNVQGAYALTLEPGSCRLAFSLIGYLPETLSVALNADLSRDIDLRQSPVVMPEMVVTSEDPAVEIIRQAIAHKHEWMEKLASYRFEAFTRQVLHRDSAIASITEAYTTGYMQMGDTLREVILQKRQTENIPGSENLTSVRRIVNFNDDEIDLFSARMNTNEASYKFVGPTATNALDNYDYKLLKTSSVNGIDVYTIRMTAKTNLRPLFNGTITIADRTFAIMGVDVRPNEIFFIPFLEDIDLHYRQQFALYDAEFWMPIDIRVNGGFRVSFVGLSFPRIGIDISSAIYDYAINTPIPDSILHGERLRVDSSATKLDSTFWKQNEVLPLTVEEQHAYTSLDSTQTLDKQFAPSGPLASLSNRDSSPSWMDKIDARFNRVEGFFFGGKFNTDAAEKHLEFSGSAGYGFSNAEEGFSLGAAWYSSKEHTFGFGGEAYRRIDHVPDLEYYSPFAIALASLIDKNDYRDYFRARGFNTFARYAPAKSLHLSAGFVSEHEESVSGTTGYGFFAGDKTYRMNPSINDGYLRSLVFGLHYGDEAVPLDIVPANYLDLAVEHSSPSVASSSFDFSRFSGGFTYNLFTFARNMLFAPMLRVRVAAGTSAGTLPPQRLFSPESRLSGYAPYGVLRGGSVREFIGNQFVTASVEHNFRSLPFLALGLPFLYRNGVELIVHGAAAQTWSNGASVSNGWYSEAGVGLSRILDLFRLDLTYRIKDPSRFYLTLSFGELL